MSEVPTRPILRYHGGKWRLANWIIKHFPKHNVYTEVFGGGGSVLFRKPKCLTEVYNDLDGGVVNLFRIARDRGEELHKKLLLTPFSREEYTLSYGEATDELEAARRFVVRSFQGFASNSTLVKSGFRGVASLTQNSARDWNTWPDNLLKITSRLHGVIIENRDYWDILSKYNSADAVHYVDPPYVRSTRDKDRDYVHELTDEQHVELAKRLHTLKGCVILSGYECELYTDLYGGWTKHTKASFADGAKRRTECLWINNHKQHQQLL